MPTRTGAAFRTVSLALLFLLTFIYPGVAPDSYGQQPCYIFSPDGATIYVSQGETGVLLTQVTINDCLGYCEQIDLTQPVIDFTGSGPSQGSITLSNPGPQAVSNPEDPTAQFNVLMNVSSDLPAGEYSFIIATTAECTEGGYAGTPGSFSLQSEEFTISVTAEPYPFTGECCLPTIGSQLNTTAVPGDRVPLVSVNITNNCGYNDYPNGDSVTQPTVTISGVNVTPSPKPGDIVLIPAPYQSNLTSGETVGITLFAILTEDVPNGFYEVSATLEVECEGYQGIQTHRLGKVFTLAVQSERDRTFFPGLQIPAAYPQDVCAAPGSTLLIPISIISDPETFKWEGSVKFGEGGKEARIMAASHRAVVTVIPPGLEGRTGAQVTGPDGRSNTVYINVDEDCISNKGEEITDEQVRKWGEEVPEDLKGRATDETGQFINFVPGEVIFQFEGRPEELESLKSKHEVKSIERIPPTDFYVARLEDDGIRNTLETADTLSGEPGVNYATENGLMTLIETELNDPNLDKQEQIAATNMFTGWRAFFPVQGHGVKLAVVDTGLDLSVKDEVRTSRFAPNGVDVSTGQQSLALLLGTSTADDRRGHGTIVAGIASAQGDNNKLGAGVAFNSRVIPIKVFGKSRFASQETIAKGLIAAFYLEADVVNMSLGCARCRPSKERQTREYFDRVLTFLYEDFENQDISPPIVVAATGNDGEGIVDTPAADPRVIAVGSYNLEKEARSSFSNYGEEVDFVAPGENVYTTLLGGEFGDGGSGTSFSSPQGAGLVALILSTQPKLKDLGTEAVKEKIKQCFVKDVGEPGFDNETGWGMIYIPDPSEVDPESCLIFERPEENR
ncbi:S8 family serine peptidase [Candidatus Bipolaricaulota bacterium]|nr:S8 family serine peptidase [Candidatus Bipolaricaulota bacterium]